MRKPCSLSRWMTSSRAPSDTVALEAVQAEIFLGHQTIRRLANIRLAIEHVEHIAGRNARALANIEIVEIMPRRDLHRAAT